MADLTQIWEITKATLKESLSLLSPVTSLLRESLFGVISGMTGIPLIVIIAAISLLLSYLLTKDFTTKIGRIKLITIAAGLFVLLYIV